MSNLKRKLPIVLRYKSGGGQKGSALYLAIIVLIILLAIVVGLTAILISQMRMVRQMGYSVIALSAADAGIERILVERGAPPFIGTGPVVPLDGANYQLTVLRGDLTNSPPDSGCETITDVYYCITSVGEYEGVRRAIEIVY